MQPPLLQVVHLHVSSGWLECVEAPSSAAADAAGRHCMGSEAPAETGSHCVPCTPARIYRYQPRDPDSAAGSDPVGCGMLGRVVVTHSDVRFANESSGVRSPHFGAS